MPVVRRDSVIVESRELLRVGQFRERRGPRLGPQRVPRRLTTPIYTRVVAVDRAASPITLPRIPLGKIPLY